MQAIIYKYGAGKNNFYALLAAILNPKLTSSKALEYFDLAKAIEQPKLRRKVTAQELPIHDIREDYEKGFTILELKLKYSITNITVTQAIKTAGGTIRTRGNNGGSKSWGKTYY